MFTGIVQGKGTVTALDHKDQFMRLRVQLPEDRSVEALQIGASIAINGTCLTVTHYQGREVSFDLISETLNVTNLGQLEVGSQVNFERAARFGDEIGGHLLSGHIHGIATVTEIDKSENNCRIRLLPPKNLLPYILPKGFVALNGCSLTVGDEVTEKGFLIYLIPETLTVTTFSDLVIGSAINLEIDSQTQAIVDTVERHLKARESSNNS